MSEIAIIGAGGFVGTSLVEALVLDGRTPVRAVVRAYRNFAGLCRFGSAVKTTVADAENPTALAAALRNAAVAVNLTTGPPAGIVRSTRTIYEACLAANVPRLVHLSSAVVYGQVAEPHLADDAPPLTRHWMPYAKAKAAAENWLRERMSDSSLDVAVVRPGIVWGVRSPHTLDIVQRLLRKDAFLVDGGKGIFNGIYIDNLVACIRACCDSSASAGGFYHVGDAETVTWREFFDALGPDLDCDPSRLAQVPGDRFPWSKSAIVDYVQSLPGVNGLYHRLKSRVPSGWKAAIKSRLAGPYNYEKVASRYSARPSVDRETWHLQKVRHKLPIQKFGERFGFSPPVTFAEAICRTVRWLSFLGLTPSLQPVESPA